MPLLVLRRPAVGRRPVLGRGRRTSARRPPRSRAGPGESVFLTTGRRDLAAFAADGAHRFLVRSVDPPDGPVPAADDAVLDRGPYTLEGERALMREHGIGLLVTKNSGGPMTAAKLGRPASSACRSSWSQRPPLPARQRRRGDGRRGTGLGQVSGSGRGQASAAGSGGA